MPHFHRVQLVPLRSQLRLDRFHNSPVRQQPLAGRGRRVIRFLHFGPTRASNGTALTQPEQRSVATSLCRYSPAIEPPPWTTKSITRKPGKGSFQSANVLIGNGFLTWRGKVTQPMRGNPPGRSRPANRQLHRPLHYHILYNDDYSSQGEE